jgi:hypothetical protein
MKEISNLITATNIYMTGNYNLPSYNHVLVRDIAIYITNLMKVISRISKFILKWALFEMRSLFLRCLV